LSIVIPTRARTGALRDCLTAIARASGGIDIEVVVVDDDPQATSVHKTVAEALRTSKASWSVARSAGNGPSVARNIGACHASSPILWFLDDDVVVPRSTPSALLREAAIHRRAVIAGGVVISTASKAPRVCPRCSIDFPLLAVSRPCAPGEMWSCNLLVPWWIYDHVGGFPENGLIYGEDFEFARRAQVIGAELRQAGGCEVVHVRSADDVRWSSLLRRRWVRGRNQVSNAKTFHWAFPPRLELARRAMASVAHGAAHRCAGGILDATQQVGQLVPRRPTRG
jgi:GT2 family glycosyltransferase